MRIMADTRKIGKKKKKNKNLIMVSLADIKASNAFMVLSTSATEAELPRPPFSTPFPPASPSGAPPIQIDVNNDMVAAVGGHGNAHTIRVWHRRNADDQCDGNSQGEE